MTRADLAAISPKKSISRAARSLGGTDSWDNLRSVCKACHRARWREQWEHQDKPRSHAVMVNTLFRFGSVLAVCITTEQAPCPRISPARRANASPSTMKEAPMGDLPMM